MAFTGFRKFKTALLLAAAIGGVLPASAAWAQESAQITQEVRELLGQYHVSGIKDSQLKGKSIEEMIDLLKKKDPYTVYFTKEELKKFTNNLESNYYGIGAQMGMDEQGIYVDKVFEGSPAEKSGLKKEDYIVKVEGVSAQGKSLDEVVNTILGPDGTKVKLTIDREGKKMDMTITRGMIQMPNVTSYLLTPSIGYMDIDSFSSDSDELFQAHLDALQEMGMTSLVIDLRDNLGGLVESAQNIASNFVEQGVFAHTKNRDGQDNPIEITKGSKLNVPVYVLMNENSASASEMLAGALQDYGAAKVVGMQSYGKGSMQSVYSLSDGSALKVTIEEYLTPSLKPVNGVGIHPDVKSDGYTAQMITALRKAGLTEFRVEVGKHDVTLNQIEVTEPHRPIREKGQVYVASRTLAALIGADIEWNQGIQGVEIHLSPGSKSTFALSAGSLLLKDGTSYINLDKFDDKYPQLQWTDANNLLQLDIE
ncbi:S41 family peptidase [Paenibacillus lutrae]|uniref:PDZ domain-containing protein n=1 Tax=Paenibacillus lutrae TaxID=2078573 RepID=A0A7X3FJF8_9BACL|nr:S41 family peptidase [Paenibacillus lutrae]MVP00437.1 PDZ domain-containing protein [Paenibacillus lutrae]